jgi:hypothetical protein
MVNPHDSERCGVCEEVKPLGNCDFGKGNPKLLATAHCRTCCTMPVRDRWRPIEAAEGKGARMEGPVRWILRKYTAAYARFVGRMTLLGCARAIRT